MKKNIVIILAVLMMCSFLMPSCSVPGSTEPSNTPTKSPESPAKSPDVVESPDEKVEIHYAYWASPMDPFYAECKAEFEAAHQNITIILEPTAWEEYWTKLETAATGGSVADVFHMNGVNILKYADGEVLLPMDDYIAGSSLDMNNYPSAMNDMYHYDGSQYGIAMDYDTMGLWYNKSLFDQAEVDYPTSDWTWEDLKEAAAAITASGDDIYGFTAGFDDQSGIYNTVFAEGGWFVDGDQFGFDDPKTRAGIQCWIDVMEAGSSPSEVSLEENAGYLQFMAGKVGMIISGNWMVAFYSSDDSSVADVCDVAEVPLMSSGKRASVIHGKANCISAATEHPDEAWAWVEYLASSEANQRMGEMGIAIPSHLKYSTLFFDTYPQYNMGIYSAAAENYSYTYPSSLSRPDWSDIVRNELQRAFKLEITVDEACDSIMSQLN